jgi:adenylate kinase
VKYTKVKSVKGWLMLKAIIFGPPGSGKGTYTSRLKDRLGVEVVAMGDLFREIIKEDSELGKRVKGFVEKGLLVPDDVVSEVLKENLANIAGDKGFILDGYPRTIDQAKVLKAITSIDLIIQLSVPEAIIVERLSTRRICKSCGEVYNVRYLKPKVDGVCDKCGGVLYQRSDDRPQVIRERIRVYERQTRPILEYYKRKGVRFVEFRTESIDMPPETAVEAIVKDLKKLGFA